MDGIPAIFCIDAEPDPREVRQPEPWLGFEAIVPLASQIRDRLSESSGSDAHLAWLVRMDLGIGAVYGSSGWGLEAHEREIAALVGAGDEIGVHPHGWRRDDGGWFIEAADEAWLAECANVALASYREAFGKPCPAHRFGEGLLVGSVLRTLRDQEVMVDLTVEPGYPARSTPPEHGERISGLLPSSASAPTVPYWASVDDPHASGGEARWPLLIPITTGVGVAAQSAGGRVLPFGVNDKIAFWNHPDQFASMLDDALDATPAHVAFAIRTDIALRPAWETVITNLETLCAHPLAAALRWSTPSDAAAVLAPGAGATPGVAVRHSQRARRWLGGAEGPGSTRRRRPGGDRCAHRRGDAPGRTRARARARARGRERLGEVDRGVRR